MTAKIREHAHYERQFPFLDVASYLTVVRDMHARRPYTIELFL